MYKDLLEILRAFIGLDRLMREVPIESEKYVAYAYCADGGFGVAIPFEKALEIHEKFNNILFHTRILKEQKFLCLWTDSDDLVVPFAGVAWDFISPGVCDENRIALLNTPFVWFEKWKSLVGNYAKDLMAYDIIGELKTFLLLADAGKHPVWTSQTLSAHDIEADGAVYEVKTTLSHAGRTVEISSLEQGEEENGLPLYLCLVRVQQSSNGETIESLRNEIVQKGYIHANEIDSYLMKKGYTPEKSEYRKGYHVYRISAFLVDEKFPRLCLTDFKENKLPKGVESISYTIHLPEEGERTIYPTE